MKDVDNPGARSVERGPLREVAAGLAGIQEKVANESPATVLDVGRSIDEGPCTPFQSMVVVLAALSIVMDGFDGQLIGFALPMIIQEWGITRAALAPAVAAGLVGMGIGSVCAGLLADRFGRRWAVIGSVCLFGAATCAIGFAPDVVWIAVLRFISGLGIGGALPTSTTMAAEFTPLRRRTLAVTATIVCVPLGGMLAGLFASLVLPVHGWRPLFVIGGCLALALCVVLVVWLPESPRFLVRNQHRWDELRQLLGRMSRGGAAVLAFRDAAEQRTESGRGLAALFERDTARDTLAIWGAFFMCLMAVYSAFNWLPTMLNAEGLDVRLAASGLTAYNLGGVFGAICCAFAIARFGSRWPLLLCCLGASASAFVLQQFSVKDHAMLLIGGLAVHGLFVNAVQSTMYALCAHVYPTAVRATGLATALVLGRFGAILSAIAGAAVIAAGGGAYFLAALGLAMAAVFISLALVRRHIPALPRSSTATVPLRA